MTDEVLNDAKETENSSEDAARAAFNAAFNGESAPDPTEGQTPEPPVEESQPEQPVFTQADIDRIRVEAAAEAEQRHIKRIRDLSGEVGGLKQKLESMTTAQAAAKESGAEAPTAKQIADAMTDPAVMESLKKDFPEWGQIAESQDKRISETNKRIAELEGKLSAAEEARNSATSTAEELATLREMRRLDKAHPDWEEAVESTTYHQWLASQPENIQYAANESKDARDAIAILNMYKASDLYKQATTSQEALTVNSRQKTQRLESAITPTRGGQASRPQPKTAHEIFVEAFNSR